MFKNPITSTPLTNDVANEYFANITGQYFSNDCSMLATLRALVYPRMKPDEKISVYFKNSDFDGEIVKNHSAEVLMHQIFPQPLPGEIKIHSLNNRREAANEVFFDFIDKNYTAFYGGFIRVTKITDFYRKSFKVYAYVNPDEKSVFILTENLTFARLHFLQCAIFAFLPWYFNPKDGASVEEMELINSLREKDSHKYSECLRKIADKYDFYREFVRRQLKGFETRFEREELSAAERHVEENMRFLTELNNKIAAVLRENNDYNIKILGLQSKIRQDEDGDSEIMDYFMCNKRLFLNRASDTYIVFTCMDYLEYFDEDAAERAIENKNSYVYVLDNMACNNYIQHDDMHDLMRAIFIDQTLRIKFCAIYEFDLTGYVRAKQCGTYDSRFDEAMPNPHIDKYSCMGNYQRVINQMLAENQYIQAIEQCIASCKSLNFGDAVVMAAFMRNLYGIDGTVNNRCIELPNGEVVDARGAVKWMRENEKKEEA